VLKDLEKKYGKRWMEEHWEVLKEEYEENLALCYARFHGMFVEYNKRKKRVKKI